MALLPPDPIYSIRNVNNSPVHSLAFHFLPGGVERLLAGSRNGYVYAYNLQTNRMQQKLRVGTTSILKLHHSDYTLITQEKANLGSGVLKCYTLSESGYVEDRVIETDHSGFCRFEISTEYKNLYVPSINSVVKIYNLKGEKINHLKPEGDIKYGEVMAMRHLDISNNPYLLAAYESGDMCLWDIISSQCVTSTKFKDCPMSVDFDLNAYKGVYGSVGDVIQLFRLGRNDLKLQVTSEIPIKGTGVNTVSIRKDQKIMVSGGWDGRLRLFSWKSLRPLAVLTEHKSAIQDVVYSSQKVSLWNANIMAAGGNDGLITLWDLYN